MIVNDSLLSFKADIIKCRQEISSLYRGVNGLCVVSKGHQVSALYTVVISRSPVSFKCVVFDEPRVALSMITRILVIAFSAPIKGIKCRRSDIACAQFRPFSLVWELSFLHVSILDSSSDHPWILRSTNHSCVVKGCYGRSKGVDINTAGSCLLYRCWAEHNLLSLPTKGISLEWTRECLCTIGCS